MIRVVQLSLLGITIALFPSCGNMASSRNFDPSIDPLDSPGSQRRGEASNDGPRYVPGSYVEVTDTNAGLYRRFPDEEVQPSLQLALGTQLKVLRERGSYLRVETASGQIGFVPAIMVSNSASSQGVVVSDGTIVPVTPVDPADPSGLGNPSPDPEGNAPFLAPEPEVPPISVERAEIPPPASSPEKE